MLLNRKSRRADRVPSRRPTYRPSLEAFERRELLAVLAQPFLQGTVFVDTGTNGVQSTAEKGLQGATVILENLAGTKLATATTDANGNYSFVSGTVLPGGQALTLTPGTTYQLVESTANYASTGASALSEIDTASVASSSTIQVTVVDPNKVIASLTSAGLAGTPTDGVSYNLNGVPQASSYATPLLFNLSGPAGVNTATYTALCVNVTDSLSYNTPFGSTIDNQSAIADGGQIAYIFNHDATAQAGSPSLPAGLSGISTQDLVAGAQVAIWELEYGPAFQLTGFPSGYDTAQDYANLQTAAAGFIADSVGKSENVAIIDASKSGVVPTPSVTAGAQSVLAAEDFNFGVKASFPGQYISGVAYNDHCGTGLSNTPTSANVPYAGSTAEAGVTIDLSGPNGLGLSTTTAADGSYSFGNLAPGTYTVTETTPGGLVETGPALGSYTVAINATTPTSTSDNFSNFTPVSTSTIAGITYTVNGKAVPDLRGATAQGSVVSVSFTNTSTTPVTLSLVGYSAPAPTFSASTASQQQIVALQTGSYGYGMHTLTITLPDGDYQVDFVAGCPIYAFGPAGSNIFYSPEGRLIDADNGGAQPYATSTLSGTVYVNSNGNDTFGPGDATLANVPVTLTGTTSAGVAVPAMMTTTSPTGTYSFAGLAPGVYTVVAATPAGDIAEAGDVGSVGGTSGTGSISSVGLNSNTAATGYNFGEIATRISGVVYVDASGAGLTTANVPPAGSGDTPESGVTVNLDNSSGALVASAVTGPDGSYSFSGQPLGTYYVAETVPAAQYQTGPAALYYAVTTTAASPTSAGDNFSNYMQCGWSGLTGVTYTVTTPAGVSKTVSNLRGNTAQGDIVTANFTIAPGSAPVMLSLVAYEAPTSSYSSSNASQQVLTSVATGTFGPGTYSLTVVEPNSYFQVDFVCGAPLAQLEANGSHVDYNFENRLISADNGGTQAYAPSTISGIAYGDVKGTGSYASGDAVLSGVTITLTGTTLAGQAINLTTTSAANGSYSFTGLIPGFYSVSALTPSGYVAENGDVGSINGAAYAGYLGTSGTGSVSWIGLNSNSAATNYNFGEVKLATISGTVYVDKNFDGGYDGGDTGLAGVTVYLENTSGGIVATTTTGGSGAYSFAGVTPGVYQVVESKPSSYTAEPGDVGTSGGSAGVGSVTGITLASGANATGYNLGQVKSASPCGYYCGSAGQWQIQSDCGSAWSSNLWSWLSKNCSSICNGSNGWSGSPWAQNNFCVALFCQSLQNQYGSGSMQCQMLDAALDQYFGKC